AFTDQLRATRAKINWDQVYKIASSIKGQPCTSNNDKFSGGCNTIYPIIFEDGTSWALRVPHDMTPVEPTVTTMDYVKNTVPTIPIATVHAWSNSENGDGVGTPYILLDWIEGSTLTWTATSPPPKAREKVLAQLAQYSVDMLVHTTEPIQSSTGTMSALAWTLRRIDSRLRRIINGDLPLFDPIDCLIYRAMAEEKYHISSLDTLQFPLMHTDLNPRNILVDGDFNITGILDWDEWVCRLPLQFAVRCPTMIALGDDPSPDDLFLKDRLSFIEHFTSSLHSSGLPDNITAQLLPIVANEEQQVFQSAIGSKGLYAYWVGKYLVHRAEWLNAAAGALDRFVQANPKLAGSAEVMSIRAHLLNFRESRLGHSKGGCDPIP
ncbi:hypothetical protein AN958_10452, partial [Leucoagaricus sp. SymC.cos]